MGEIISAYKSRGGEMLPHSMRKGFKEAFNKFDNYQLTKYQNLNNSWKLRDIINLVRPIPTEKNKKALQTIIQQGKIENTETWESKLSLAGKCIDGEKIDAAKKQAWFDLIKEKKLGYFALLRNLRNILIQAPETIDLVTELLINSSEIKKSKILPFRFLAAYKQIKTLPNYQKLIIALSRAIEIAFDNVPNLEGTNLIVVDISGSMGNTLSSHSQMCLIDVASLFAASIIKKNNKSDLMLYNTKARYTFIHPSDSIFSISEAIKNQLGGGTAVSSIFKEINKAYDRIIIISDEQTWDDEKNTSTLLKNYKKEYNCNPKLHCINLDSGGTISFPENEVFCLGGYSEKIFDVIKYLEVDKNSIVKKIKDWKI